MPLSLSLSVSHLLGHKSRSATTVSILLVPSIMPNTQLAVSKYSADERLNQWYARIPSSQILNCEMNYIIQAHEWLSFRVMWKDCISHSLWSFPQDSSTRLLVMNLATQKELNLLIILLYTQLGRGCWPLWIWWKLWPQTEEHPDKILYTFPVGSWTL